MTLSVVMSESAQPEKVDIINGGVFEGWTTVERGCILVCRDPSCKSLSVGSHHHHGLGCLAYDVWPYSRGAQRAHTFEVLGGKMAQGEALGDVEVVELEPGLLGPNLRCHWAPAVWQDCGAIFGPASVFVNPNEEFAWMLPGKRGDVARAARPRAAGPADFGRPPWRGTRRDLYVIGCPKLSYKDRELAEIALRFVQEQEDDYDLGCYYHRDCGRWHLGH